MFSIKLSNAEFLSISRDFFTNSKKSENSLFHFSKFAKKKCEFCLNLSYAIKNSFHFDEFFDDFDVIKIFMDKIFYMRIFGWKIGLGLGMYLTFQLVLGTAALQEAEIANNILESHFHRIDITKGSVGWWTTRHSFGQVLNFGCVRWKSNIFVYICHLSDWINKKVKPAFYW